MKKAWLMLLAVVVASPPSMATTKTVGKSGAQFTSIQAAINSFTEAEITDGQPDVVEIIDNAEYNEQVAIGGLVSNPDNQSAGYLDAAIELALKRDAFTLRGQNSSDRPKINPTSGGVTYGVFTDDPTDSFYASLSYLGKDITIENIEILQSSLINDDQYGINGQAGNTVFKNVLFAHSGDKQPGEALINLNNDVSIAAKGFDNSYTFVNCTIDGAVADVRGGNDAVYFHGYSQGDADSAGVDIDKIPVNIKFENCNFQNCSTASMIRGRAQANNVAVQNCYISENDHGLRASGKGTFMVDSSIFYNNMAEGGDADNDRGALETVGRDGFTPQVTVKNSLFAGNISADFDSLSGIPGIDFRAAAIRIVNDGTDPDLTIENCTFVNNPVAIRFADVSGRPRKATINKSIFQNNNSSVLTADDAQASYFASVDSGASVTALEVTGADNVFDGNFVVVEWQELLPNVKLNGTESKVTFTNPVIDPADPFTGPPYLVSGGASAGIGANLGSSTAVNDFMLFE